MWEKDNDNPISVELASTCSEESIEDALASEVKQISNVISSCASTKPCNAVSDRKGLLPSPLPKLERDVTSQPLEFVAPISFDENGRPHLEGILNRRKIKFLIDTSAQISVTNHKLYVEPDAPECNIVGFNGQGNAIAKKVSNVKFEIPGMVKIDMDIFCCPNAVNIFGMDIINRVGWIIDLGSGIIWKDPVQPRSMVIDPSEYVTFGSICAATSADVLIEHKCPETYADVDLRELVQKFPSLWSKNKNDFGTLKDTELIIEGRDPRPQPQFDLPMTSIKPVTAIIQEYMKQGLLRQADSVVNSFVWAVINSDDSYSLSVDFRMLNKYITNKTPFVPENPDIMSHLDAKAKIFSVLEIANSHFSVPIAQNSQYKFAFTFQKKQYVFTRLPPNLSITDNIVHELVAKVLSTFSRKECIFQHVDKLLISTETVEEHLMVLTELFNLFQQEGLKLNTETAELMRSHVTFSGMQISCGKRELLEEQVKAILAIPIPKCRKALLDFLNKVGKCKTFIQRYADKVRPLHHLLHKKCDTLGMWSDAQKNAFEILKKDLQTAPTLSTVNESNPFVLQTNVSNDAIFVTLSQQKDDEKNIIAYFSRLLTPIEKNYKSHVKQEKGETFAKKVTHDIVKSKEVILQKPDSSI